jgi:sterol desaturase/sphingolipid hydroxylase (fatty acid hydroxylase superfamily)
VVTLDAWSVPLFVLAAALLMMLVERRWPGRAWPKVRGWWPRALALNALQAGSVFLAGVLWEPWLRAHRLWSAEPLGPALGVGVAYLVHTFVYYWWHRARHQVPLLWRWVHQVHHSPARIELITSFYKHPIEILVNGVLSSAVLYIVVGLDPATASATMLVNGLAELVYHWNVKTPHWLGYVIQRPESHLVHHQYGLHRHNYADLPIFDMLFGTFRNPEQWQACCGLGSEQEQRLVEMLAGKDVGSVPVKPQS